MLPFVALGDLPDEGKSSPHEGVDVRRENPLTDEGACPAEWHGESKFIVQQDGAAGLLEEGMVVFEGGESACDHAVAEEEGRLKVFDEAFVILGQAQMPSLPAHGVSIDDEARGASADRAHVEFALDDGEAGREQEAALDGGVDGGFVLQGEEAGHGFSLRYESWMQGRTTLVLVAVLKRETFGNSRNP